jgi:hypothetical protein
MSATTQQKLLFEDKFELAIAGANYRKQIFSSLWRKKIHTKFVYGKSSMIN